MGYCSCSVTPKDYCMHGLMKKFTTYDMHMVQHVGFLATFQSVKISQNYLSCATPRYEYAYKRTKNGLKVHLYLLKV